MDTYEVFSLLFLGGSFLLALLAYIDRNNMVLAPCKKGHQNMILRDTRMIPISFQTINKWYNLNKIDIKTLEKTPEY